MGYLTKNESGMSKLLKAVNDQAKGLSNLDLIKEISGVLDKHREVSIQEATYRMLSLPMTKSSIRVKYLSAIHPHHRDGLLKGDIQNLEDNESIFHMSPHQYYESRHLKCIPGVNYDDEELQKGYWGNLSLIEFWANYDIHYGENIKAENGNFKYIPLEDNKGYIKRRQDMCIIRYYLNHSNDEDLARGLLILFHPFQNEMTEIHEQNVTEMYLKNRKEIERKRSQFEKHKVLTDIINLIQREKEDAIEEENALDDDYVCEETTAPEEIDSFEKWAKSQAKGALQKHKELTTLVRIDSLREMIMKLNEQQRRIFDDFCERLITDDDQPVYLYIAGEAGTGKSYLLKIMIEIVKHLKLKSGDELNKPAAIVMAPTANAAYIINGKTIESALGMLPRKQNTFVNIQRSQLSNLSFLYDGVGVVFCDEISMVGSSKFTKINFQLQDIFCNNSFMGGVSFIAVGDLRQLPPVLDSYIYENNNLDGRPAISPSHWDEHFRIFYLTDKMRSQRDPEFSSICDRVGNGKYTKKDIKYLDMCVRETESENSNENFKEGKLSYIVTTNKRRQEVNDVKLDKLLSDEPAYESLAFDRCTNLEHPPEVPSNLAITQTGGLEKKLVLKRNAPIVITSNHQQSKYKEDGLVNGARGHIDSIQFSKSDPNKIEAVWVIFKDKQIGRRLRFDLKHLKGKHRTYNQDAIPILKQKKQFTINRGEVRFQRHQFPLTLAYAITAYKCQGETLEEVIIDFSHDTGGKGNIQTGSFYVALTRVKEGKDVYLKSFEESYITYNARVEEKIESMRKFKPYIFKKIYISDPIFECEEMKVGYFNVEGFLESNHAAYLDNDLNLLELSFLIISETWLTVNISNGEVIKKLKNWKIIKRLDSTDNGKHMGLMLISPCSKTDCLELIFDMDYVEGYTDGNTTLLYQGITMNLRKCYKKLVFLYIRKTPSQAETVGIACRFSQFDCIMGDLNLNPALLEQKNKLGILCGDTKYLALEETTTLNHNQLDHIILEKELSGYSFVTSYNNFASYHKSIVLRLATEKGKFIKEFSEGQHFDKEKHLKTSTKNQPMHDPKVKASSKTKPRGKKSSEQKKTPNTILHSSIDLITLRFNNPWGKNLCFSNVVVSCLLNIPPLRKYLQGKKNVEENPRSIVYELTNLARHLSDSQKSTQRLRTIVMAKCLAAGQTRKNFNSNRQFDCVEFLQALLEHFWMEVTEQEYLEELVFGGIYQEKLTCECKNVRILPIKKMDEIIHLQVTGQNIQDSLEAYIESEEVESKCSECQSPDMVKTSEIVFAPATLIFHLLRSRYDEN